MSSNVIEMVIPRDDIDPVDITRAIHTADAILSQIEQGALWTLGVLVVIQELEGMVLSPRLVGGATSLHPMAVLLLVSAGGMIAGALGMLLAVPLVVSIRGAVRGWRE